MKKMLVILLAVIMAVSNIPAMASEPGWDMPSGYYSAGGTLEFRPFNNYYSHQNSPSFSWPIIFGATYEIILCSDKELQDVKYRETDLSHNVFTFPYTLEGNKAYYWAVRYKLNGKNSAWSEPRRFYIDPMAYEFTQPKVGDIGEIVKEHPIFFSEKELDAIARIDKTTPEFISYKKNIDAFVNAKKYHDGKLEEGNLQNGEINEMVMMIPFNQTLSSTLMFYITGEQKYLDFALKQVEVVKDINPSEMFPFKATMDTVEGYSVYHFAYAYDLLEPYMSKEQKEISVKIMEKLMERPWEFHAYNGDMNHKMSLYAMPYTSHPWGLNRCCLAALTIYNDSEFARKMVEYQLPMFLFTNNYSSSSLEDGSSAWGNFYGAPNGEVLNAKALSASGVADLSGKAKFANLMTNYLYTYPYNWVSSTGDSYGSTMNSMYQSLLCMTWLSAYTPIEEYREYAKWTLKHINNGSTQYYYPADHEHILNNANQDTKISLPHRMPTGKMFKDTGIAGIFSDIKDPERVGLTFRSSYFGSGNHAHPDQNSFVIQAYGENILDEVSYYQSMNDAIYTSFLRKTYAHNAITYNSGSGQTMSSVNAKGKITEFINQRDFSLVSGDATEAYEGALGKAERDIIYIYPETYIIIDDLNAGLKKKTFEFLLQTKGDISFYGDTTQAQIVQGKATAEVRSHYPKGIEANYIDYFAGPDLQKAPGRADLDNAPDKRLFYQTGLVDETKLVTTIDLHRTGTRARNVKEESFEDYIKLSFEDGTVCYINLTDKEKIVTKDGIEFSADAFVYNSRSAMMVNGTLAVIDGREIFSSDVPVSVASGNEEIAISSLEEDANVKIAVSEKPGKLIKQDDNKLINIEEGTNHAGLLWNYQDGYITAKVYPFYYILYTDKKELAGKKGSGVLKITASGKTDEIPFESEFDINGKLTCDYWMDNYEGIYVVQEMNGVSSDSLEVGNVANISGKISIYAHGENPELVIKDIGDSNYNVIADDDQTVTEKLLDSQVRATDFVAGGKGGKVTYWERIKNNTLQSFVAPMETITYELNVPEDGKYDFAMSLSTVSMATSKKALIFGDTIGTFVVPATPVYSDLQGIRVKCGLELKKGLNRITFMNLDEGRCIFDWIGLIKSDK